MNVNCFTGVSLSLQNFRGTALGFYNWGIYIGYSLAFAFNFILRALNWQWAFRIASFPGFVVSAILVVTVREPKRRREEVTWSSFSYPSFPSSLSLSLIFLSPLLALTLIPPPITPSLPPPSPPSSSCSHLSHLLSLPSSLSQDGNTSAVPPSSRRSYGATYSPLSYSSVSQGD